MQNKRRTINDTLFAIFITTILVQSMGLAAAAVGEAVAINAPAVIEKIEAPFPMPPLNRPLFKDQVFDIIQYGAKGDGKTKNTEAFIKAIEACSESGGGQVLVPKGKWLTGAIHLKSDVNLHMQEGAEIHFSDELEDYLPVVFQRWAGAEVMNYSPLIYAYDCENIAVTGPGKLYGHGHRWQKWFKSEQYEQGSMLRIYNELILKDVPVEKRVFGTTSGAFGDPEHPGLRPSFISPVNCRNVLLEGFTIAGYGPYWTVHPVYCENVIIRGLSIHTVGGHNADGIDLDSSRNVLVEYCFLDTGDDALAIHTGMNEEGRRIGRPTENVVIRHLQVKRGHGGVVIGSLTSGGVRNVLAYACDFDGADKGIRLKSNKARGGVVENIWYRDIMMRRIKEEAVIINTTYASALPAGESEVSYPIFRNITLETITCESAGKAVSFDASTHAPIENVTMTDISIKARRGMNFSWVDGLKLKNVETEVSEGELIIFDNCKDVLQE